MLIRSPTQQLNLFLYLSIYLSIQISVSYSPYHIAPLWFSISHPIALCLSVPHYTHTHTIPVIVAEVEKFCRQTLCIVYIFCFDAMQKIYARLHRMKRRHRERESKWKMSMLKVVYMCMCEWHKISLLLLLPSLLPLAAAYIVSCWRKIFIINVFYT